MLKGFIIKMALAGLFLLLFSLRFVDMTIGEQITDYPLETAWKVTGLSLREISTETWMKLNDRWLSVYDLKAIAGEIRSKLGFTARTKLLFGEQNGFNYVSCEGLCPDGTVVTVTLQSSSAGGTGETQVGINTSRNGKIKNIRDYVGSLTAMITKIGADSHISVLLAGERRGKVPAVLVKELAGEAFRRVGAELVDSGFVNNNSSQKGYTRLIKDTVVDDGKRINIEIETRYDEIRNVTEIIMASPNTSDGV